MTHPTGSVTTIALLLWMTAMGLAADTPPPDGASPAPATVTASIGDYQVAWLTLERGWGKGGTVRLFLGLRNGKAAVVWFCGPAPHAGNNRVWSDDVQVELVDGGLSGSIKGRLVTIWAPFARVGSFEYRIRTKVAAGKATGTFTGELTRGEKVETVQGPVTGTVETERQRRATHALPAGKDWPSHYGVRGAMRGPDCGATLVDTLQQARPAWKSEDPAPTCWGNAPDGRYAERAAFTGTTGGASTPVVAGGRVYLYYYRPVGPVPVEREDEVRRRANRFTDRLERSRFLDFWRIRADDVVVCMDAVTGQTLWKAVFKERAGNIQTHKWRGYNPTPCVEAGRVYVQNYFASLYCLDARTGKVLWDVKGGRTFDARNKAERASRPSGAGPVVADGVVAFSAGEVRAFDAKTARPLWEAPRGNVGKWTDGGKEYFVAGTAGIEPRTGKVLWRLPGSPNPGGFNFTPLIDGNVLLGYFAGADRKAPITLGCFRLGAKEARKQWEMPVREGNANADWWSFAVAGGHVFLSGAGRGCEAVDLTTGKVAGAAPMVDAQRTSITFAADKRVLVQPEGRHGGQSFTMIDASHPRALGAAGDPWVPPHPHTTAYANMPIAYPLVDGRLFVRGFDGVYCYDLRARFTASPRSGLGPLAVTLRALPWPGDPASVRCEWDLGDGARASGAKVTHTYAPPGKGPRAVYRPRLTVAGPGGRDVCAPSAITVCKALAASKPAGVQPGLLAQYYEGKFARLPDLSKLKPLSTSTVDRPSVSPAKRKDSFALRFTGWLDVPRAGLYTFRLDCDDRGKLWIDGHLVAARDRGGSPVGLVGLQAGKHRVELDYVEFRWGEHLRLLWSGPGIPHAQPVPASAFWRNP